MQTSISAIFLFGSVVVGGILLPKKMYKTFYVFGALCIAAGMAKQVTDAYKLLNHGMNTAGTIRAVDCENHGRIFFEYQVYDHVFEGEESASSGGLVCGEVQIGSHIVVRYLETDPQQAIAGNINSDLREHILFALLSTLGFPGLAIFFHKRKVSSVNEI